MTRVRLDVRCLNGRGRRPNRLIDRTTTCDTGKTTEPSCRTTEHEDTSLSLSFLSVFPCGGRPTSFPVENNAGANKQRHSDSLSLFYTERSLGGRIAQPEYYKKPLSPSDPHPRSSPIGHSSPPHTPFFSVRRLPSRTSGEKCAPLVGSFFPQLFI